MTREEIADLLTRFASRPIPPVGGRHVYVWHGELSDLDATIPRDIAVHLDLYELARSLTRTPYTTDEARRVMHGAVADWLQQHPPRPGSQQVVAVSGTPLLARYGVPLSVFIQASSDSRMVILVVTRQESRRPSHTLPPYVSFNPDATLAYLKTSLGVDSVVGATQ